MKKIVFDIETTGFSKTSDVITQFAAQIRDETGKLIEKINFYLKHPFKKITNPKVIEITGIDQDFLEANGIDYNEGINKIAKILLECDYFIGHNIIMFDLPFVLSQIQKVSIPKELMPEIEDDYLRSQKINEILLAKASTSSFDTLIQSRKLDNAKRTAPGYKLEELITKYGLNQDKKSTNYHNASFDVEKNWTLYEFLDNKLKNL